MNDQVATLVRTILKVVAGMLVTKGMLDAGAADGAVDNIMIVAGGISGLVGVVWSAKAAKEKAALKANQ